MHEVRNERESERERANEREREQWRESERERAMERERERESDARGAYRRLKLHGALDLRHVLSQPGPNDLARRGEAKHPDDQAAACGDEHGRSAEARALSIWHDNIVALIAECCNEGDAAFEERDR